MIELHRNSVVGSWKIVSDRSLGGGNFGEVYEVRKEHADGRVFQRGALKIQKISGEAASEAFAEEIIILDQLKNLPTTHLIDSGVTESGMRWFVMDFLDGTTLDKLGLPLALPDWLSLARGLLSLLTQLKKLGVAHRDIWPPNVMKLKNGEYTIIDFGLSRMPFDNRELAVNLKYRAPELEVDNGDARSDLYSVGLVLAAALTGRELREHWESGHTLHDVGSIESQWADFLEAFLADDANDRPDAQELLLELDGRLNGTFAYTSGDSIRTWHQLEAFVIEIGAVNSKDCISITNAHATNATISLADGDGRLEIQVDSNLLIALNPYQRSEVMRAGFDIAPDFSSLQSREKITTSDKKTPQLVRALRALGVRLAGSRMSRLSK